MMYCAERIEYFQLRKDNVDEFVDGFGKRVFRIGEEICGSTYQVNDNGVEIWDKSFCETAPMHFVPFEYFAVHYYSSNQTRLIPEEKFKETYYTID